MEKIANQLEKSDSTPIISIDHCGPASEYIARSHLLPFQNFLGQDGAPCCYILTRISNATKGPYSILGG